jgi:filamentous hemagglutinin
MPNVDKRGNPQPGRIYEFDQGAGFDPIRIRDDAAGHDFGPDDGQNRGPHFNDREGNHYDY